MLGSVAGRSLNAAAADLMNLRVLAERRDGSRGIAAQQLGGRVKVHLVQYSYGVPAGEGGEMNAAPLSTGRYEYTDA